MLVKVLRSTLRPYKRQIGLIVAFQSVQTTAALLLPTINARIIDDGVLHQPSPDQGFIRSEGALMLGVTLVQGLFAAAAVYYGAKVAMAFGRDLRAALFHQVTDFSAREVSAFGAPSLITRITNDVQQVQMLVVMTCTMAIGAPITITVGVIMALRQDVGLSVVLAVAIPVAAVVLGTIVAAMVPAFQKMQERIDQINRVLREQITGIRVVRAFVREPQETERFSDANADLTEVSLRAGRLMSSMFPIVNLLINLSSAAVVWIGADHIARGDLEIGSLVAYLSYLVQILWSVVMATFMVSMIPRASVAAERIQEVLDTPPSVVPPSRPVIELARAGELELDDVGFHYPGAEQAVLSDITFTTRAGHHHRDRGQHRAPARPRWSTSCRGCSMPRRARCCVGGVDVRELDPEILWSSIGLVPQRPVPVLGHGGDQPPVRQARRHRGRDVGGAPGRPGRGLRAGHARRARGHHRAGRHQRVGRAAPAPLHRPGAGAPAGHLPVRRLVLRPRPRHRRPAARRPRPRTPRAPPW